uniref:18 kDa Sin3-associated polypeptide n=1 Tax=Neolamprologus brichardi TaxID=32507 RepID=A0A3Q4IBG1_NEOBR
MEDLQCRLQRQNMNSKITNFKIQKLKHATCPLLLRVFTTNSGRHHRVDEFARGNVPSSELQIYTWMDATLKELTSLVKEVYPEARKKGTYFSFAIVIVFAFICTYFHRSCENKSGAVPDQKVAVTYSAVDESTRETETTCYPPHFWLQPS